MKSWKKMNYEEKGLLLSFATAVLNIIATISLICYFLTVLLHSKG